MQIILEEAEIKAALVAYANSMITIREDQEIDIDMKAGRGDNGYTATLNVQTKAPATTAGPVKRSTPKAVETATPATVKAAAAGATVAPAKGLFGNKPTVVANETPKAEPAPEPETVEEVTSGISTGEDRGEQEDAIQQDLDIPAETQVEERVEVEAPAEKPKSIFNFGGAKAGA